MTPSDNFHTRSLIKLVKRCPSSPTFLDRNLSSTLRQQPRPPSLRWISQSQPTSSCLQRHRSRTIFSAFSSRTRILSFIPTHSASMRTYSRDTRALPRRASRQVTTCFQRRNRHCRTYGFERHPQLRSHRRSHLRFCPSLGTGYLRFSPRHITEARKTRTSTRYDGRGTA